MIQLPQRKPPKDVKCEMRTPSVCDIPLPPMNLDAASIPLPPPSVKPSVPVSVPSQMQKYDKSLVQTTAEDVETPQDVTSGPLKFSLKVSQKPLPGADTPGEASGVFESSKDAKTDEPRPMPKLQALMKRSKPSQLPVGVLPSKTKLPATEIKTELFLPSKEVDIPVTSATPEISKVVTSVSLPVSLGTNPQTNPPEPKESHTTRETSFSLLPTSVGSSSVAISEMHTSSQGFSLSIPESSSNSLLGLSGSVRLPSFPSVTPILPTPITTIPNLMSLTVQPVQTLVTTPVTAIIPDPTIVLRQSKINMSNMQYVNPQKLRSAQMIATPLIANPAVAAQSHHTAELLARESRKRSRSRSRSSSRSRSRRRSRSGHRSSQRYHGHRRHSTSSSDESRYSSRHFQRRSRSRKSPDDRRLRDRTYIRDRDRTRRETDRKRERIPESDRHNSRDIKLERDGLSKRARSRTPKDDKRSRRRSHSSASPLKDKIKRDADKRDRHTDERTRNKERHLRDSPSQKDRRTERKSPSRTDRRSDNYKLKDGDSRSRSDNAPKKAPEGSRKPETSKSISRPHKDPVKISEVRHNKAKSRESSTESDSSVSASPVSQKRIKRSVNAKRATDMRSRKESSDYESHSSSSSSRGSTSPNHTESKAVGRKSATKNENGTNVTKSLSVRESELLNASLQSKNAGIGWISEVGSLPTTPDDHGSGVILSTASESDSMEISSDSEPPVAKTNANSGNDSDVDPGLPILCTKLPEAVSEDPGELHYGENSNVEGSSEAISASGPDCNALNRDACPVNSEVPSVSVQLCSELARGEPKYDLRERKTRVRDPAAHSEGCLTHIQPNWFRTSVPSEEFFEAFADAPKPEYVHIMDNDYSPVDWTNTSATENGLPAAILLGSVSVTSSVTHGEMRRNAFIIEYVGEVINFVEFRRRVRRYEKLGRAHHYFMALESDRFIDAGTKGNWARFVNHSCEPNCTTQKWSVDGRIRVGFFAKDDIKAGEEITIDYQFVQFGASEQKCYCGTPSCSGVMGATSKHLQDKVRLKDTAMVERRVIQLLQRNSFQSAEDMTLLLQVMVQECLTRYTRFELLKRLANTESIECLKLFRQYNGLDMLAAFMCDSDVDDWELKRQILLCLHNIPVSEQKQVQTNSRLMEIVSQWTIDPRFCRPRSSNLGGSLSLDGKHECGVINTDFSTARISTETEATEKPAHESETANSEYSGSTDALVPIYSASCCASPKTSMTSCSSPPESQHLTRSSSASALICDDWFEDHLATSRSQSSQKPFGESVSPFCSSLTVDVETGELEPSLSSADRNEQDRGVSEEERMHELQRLSQALIDKWSKLPLLLRTLFDELQRAGSAPSDTTEDKKNKTDNTTVLLNTLIQTLPRILSKVSNSEDAAAVSRLCEEMTRQLENNDNSLPAGWQSAVDPSGRTYYYNMETRIVQWEKPQGVDSEKSSACERVPQTTLTHAFISRELTRATGAQIPSLTPALQDRIRSSLTRYMMSRGAVYSRHKKPTKST
ncbi:putative histone-lysine N-methyltransferase CG1716 [Fasciola gigantica]|uniref:Putative histone-lysine N-methyltransferase CG1716 n=1 Tax=Fasciola gigantica TaxID=46835 RepID=A0A504Z8N3_FASGI|nr:putative histone-lysine N-methyltransferase CG1716 [Fasciola gigantica]